MDYFGKKVDLLLLHQTPYSQVLELQRRIFHDVVEAKAKDTLILCEHPPVFTLGRVTEEAHILFTDEVLANIGAEKFEIERGGDVTFHGPGQLVGYPILNLSHFKEDLGWYLRSLEEVIIKTIATYDLTAFRIAGRTGVWIGESGNERKICAIGVKASRWCTMHGFAFNVNTDLKYFDHIIPCGISDRGVVNLSELLEEQPTMTEVKNRLASCFEEVFGAKLIITKELKISTAV